LLNVRKKSMPSTENHINIEVAFARPDVQVIISLTVPEGTTIDQAITLSGVAKKFSEITTINPLKVGIFSKAKKLTDLIQEGDRIEIYRPLIADPKEARRKRAASNKKSTTKKNQDAI